MSEAHHDESLHTALLAICIVILPISTFLSGNTWQNYYRAFAPSLRLGIRCLMSAVTILNSVQLVLEFVGAAMLIQFMMAPQLAVDVWVKWNASAALVMTVIATLVRGYFGYIAIVVHHHPACWTIYVNFAIISTACLGVTVSSLMLANARPASTWIRFAWYLSSIVTDATIGTTLSRRIVFYLESQSPAPSTQTLLQHIRRKGSRPFLIPVFFYIVCMIAQCGSWNDRRSFASTLKYDVPFASLSLLTSRFYTIAFLCCAQRSNPFPLSSTSTPNLSITTSPFRISQPITSHLTSFHLQRTTLTETRRGLSRPSRSSDSQVGTSRPCTIRNADLEKDFTSLIISIPPPPSSDVITEVDPSFSFGWPSNASTVIKKYSIQHHRRHSWC